MKIAILGTHKLLELVYEGHSDFKFLCIRESEQYLEEEIKECSTIILCISSDVHGEIAEWIAFLVEKKDLYILWNDTAETELSQLLTKQPILEAYKDRIFNWNELLSINNSNAEKLQIIKEQITVKPTIKSHLFYKLHFSKNDIDVIRGVLGIIILGCLIILFFDQDINSTSSFDHKTEMNSATEMKHHENEITFKWTDFVGFDLIKCTGHELKVSTNSELIKSSGFQQLIELGVFISVAFILFFMVEEI